MSYEIGPFLLLILETPLGSTVNKHVRYDGVIDCLAYLLCFE